MPKYYINLSERILEKARLGEDSSSLRKELYFTRASNLVSKLNTDNLKKTFWLNIYEAYTLIMISESKDSKNFLKRKRIKFSHYLLSLEDIKYGILKAHKYKIGIYYINNPFYPNFIKRLAVEKTDKHLNQSLNKMPLNKKTKFEKDYS
ncbi:DUF547 domain-containing protein [Flavobacterium lacustre]|uniref:DUF547 domain-containing protein n=1 Tax=Flavobacterium lacustre TaxID=3016339 RepID=UPI0022B6E9EB|nr:DUF547 domain-containing protein [Flavobacterium lacustre]